METARKNVITSFYNQLKYMCNHLALAERMTNFYMVSVKSFDMERTLRCMAAGEYDDLLSKQTIQVYVLAYSWYKKLDSLLRMSPIELPEPYLRLRDKIKKDDINVPKDFPEGVDLRGWLLSLGYKPMVVGDNESVLDELGKWDLRRGNVDRVGNVLEDEYTTRALNMLQCDDIAAVTPVKVLSNEFFKTKSTDGPAKNTVKLPAVETVSRKIDPQGTHHEESEKEMHPPRSIQSGTHDPVGTQRNPAILDPKEEDAIREREASDAKKKNDWLKQVVVTQVCYVPVALLPEDLEAFEKYLPLLHIKSSEIGSSPKPWVHLDPISKYFQPWRFVWFFGLPDDVRYLINLSKELMKNYFRSRQDPILLPRMRRPKHGGNYFILRYHTLEKGKLPLCARLCVLCGVQGSHVSKYCESKPAPVLANPAVLNPAYVEV